MDKQEMSDRIRVIQSVILELARGAKKSDTLISINIGGNLRAAHNHLNRALGQLEWVIATERAEKEASDE